jgi:hypothetical protein
MCLLHDQEEYGIVRWPLKEIAQAVNCSVAALKGLVVKGILKGGDAGHPVDAFIYVPRSGRKDGDPITLVPVQDGPIWYSSRMVKDEYVRKHAGASTRFGADGEPPKGRAPNPNSDRAKLRQRVFAKTDGRCHHCRDPLGDVWEIDHLMPRSKGGRHTFDNMVPSCVQCNQDKSDTLPDDWEALKSSPTRRQGASPTRRQGASPTRRQGEWQGDGSSSSSSSSPSGKTNSVPDGTDAGASGNSPTEKSTGQLTKDELWAAGKSLLMQAGMPKAQCGSYVGKLVKDYGDQIVIDAVRTAVVERPADAASFLKATCQTLAGQRTRPNKQEQLEAKNRQIAERLAREGS